ncbi:MAG: hypothetical protein E7661_08225 [Ruminococcaceae bacterium]|nr:hypothetical protein [Oscillospiraceae bacterium]
MKVHRKAIKKSFFSDKMKHNYFILGEKMKTMKYLTILAVLLMALSFALTACSGGNVPEDTTATEGQTTAPVTEAPGTEAPATGEPETGVPITDEPETNELEIDEPETNEFETNESETNESETNEPTTEVPHEHVWGDWTKEKTATCTEKGSEKRTCACGESESREIAALGHTEVVDAAVEATCTETGLTEGKHCSVCNAVLVAQETVAAKGHTKIIDATATAPTCTETGLTESAHCSVCNAILAVQEIVTAIKHNFVDRKCEYCHAKLSEGLEFISRDDGRCYVSGIGTCEDLDIIIPEVSPEGDQVIGIYNEAFSDCDNLISVQIPDGVTWIGSNAFYNCDNLMSIKIPDSVNTINNSAFYESNKLYQKDRGVYYVDRWIVDCDNDVKNVELRENTAGICPFAFAGSNLISIEIPASVISISDYAFDDCSSLRSVMIADNSRLMSIGRSAFEGCSSLTSIKFGENSQLLSLGVGAFYNCSNLTSIKIPASVTNVANAAFEGCNKLIKKKDGVSYVDKWVIDCDTSVREVTLRADTVAIGYSAFSGCKKLTSISIPYHVTLIATYAFHNCSSLKSIDIVEWGLLTSIGDSAFSGCSSLKSIVIPAGVTNIDPEMFYGCSSLTSIIVDDNNPIYHDDGNCLIETATKTLVMGCKTSAFPTDGSVTSIGHMAFSNCSSIKSIEIPASIISISTSAFLNRGSLTSIKVDDNNPTYHDNDNCLIETATKTLVLGCETSVIPTDGSVTNIGSRAFYGCSSLTSIVIPDGVTNISNSAFRGCHSLTSIVIPDSVTTVDDYAFEDCRELSNIIFGENSHLKNIGKYVFSGCINLTLINVPSHVTIIDDCAFFNCSSLQSVGIADNSQLTSIGSSAFYNCRRLTSIKFGENSQLSRIGGEAFSGCNNLVSIVIPDSVTSVDSSAFSGCSKLIQEENNVYYVDRWVLGADRNWFGSIIILRSDAVGICDNAFYDYDHLITIELPDSVTSIGECAFYSCWMLTSVVISDGVKSLGENAFGSCENLTSITFTGNKSKWQAIDKNEDWNNNTGNYTVHCTDGDIPKTES